MVAHEIGRVPGVISFEHATVCQNLAQQSLLSALCTFQLTLQPISHSETAQSGHACKFSRAQPSDALLMCHWLLDVHVTSREWLEAKGFEEAKPSRVAHEHCNVLLTRG